MNACENARLPTPTIPPRMLPPRGPQLPVGRSMENEAPFVLLGSIPLIILAIEMVVACVLGFVAVLFFATIYLAFVGLFLYYIALWLGVVFNTAGTLLAAVATLAGRRHPIGLSTAITGLVLNAAMLGGAVYGLMLIHGW